MKSTLLIAAVFFFASCSKEWEDNNIVICGRFNDSTVYKGKFERSSIAGVQSAAVELKFKDNTFVGTSAMPMFPAIGSGTFTTSASSVNFKNQNIWTANFDWTLILDR